MKFRRGGGGGGAKIGNFRLKNSTFIFPDLRGWGEQNFKFEFPDFRVLTKMGQGRVVPKMTSWVSNFGSSVLPLYKVWEDPKHQKNC